ncbi:uncharacterized protein LOC119583206 [Penaeus monodon]|uniref:uncharacterized protein LOC119583206 n=1 Tax=Penaeus monodon TaxID=6687 RepID=UPI0018A76B7E|nr:uncharacterized protein LOC119583206 [Penaeus monodon]
MVCHRHRRPVPAALLRVHQLRENVSHNNGVSTRVNHLSHRNEGLVDELGNPWASIYLRYFSLLQLPSHKKVDKRTALSSHLQRHGEHGLLFIPVGAPGELRRPEGGQEDGETQHIHVHHPQTYQNVRDAD